MPGLLDFINLRDMFDGGGAGRSGQRFEGGHLSGLLNDMGIRQLGYNDRMDDARPMPRPAPPMPPRPAPKANPYAPGAVTTTTLPPTANIGSMSPADVLALLNRVSPPPYAPKIDGVPNIIDMMIRDEIMRGQRAAAGFDNAIMFPMGAR